MQIDTSMPSSHHRSYSDPLPRDLICDVCTDAFRVDQGSFAIKFLKKDVCSMECFWALQKMNEMKDKDNARQIIKLFQDRVEKAS